MTWCAVIYIGICIKALIDRLFGNEVQLVCGSCLFLSVCTLIAVVGGNFPMGALCCAEVVHAVFVCALASVCQVFGNTSLG